MSIPQSIFTCITGVAGSGKSTLIHQGFLKAYPQAIVIDQNPIGRSNRSNPATYTGVFDKIRKLFARTNDQDPSLFSFNSKGACIKCKGVGHLHLEMAFLDPVKTVCNQCHGSRYRDQVLRFQFSGKSIADILEMTITEAGLFFSQQEILRRLSMLKKVGLGYLKLGQSLTTLSGGECQRIKLASELHRRGNIYILDEPTTGLHLSDIARLLDLFDTLVDQGNTLIVIEHCLHVIWAADWVIDMGPEGGSNGGEVIFEGTPRALLKHPKSYTGKFLKRYLQKIIGSVFPSRGMHSEGRKVFPPPQIL